MQVRRRASGDSSADATPGEWRGPGPHPVAWYRKALPGRAARAVTDAVALASALLIATLLRHDGHIGEVDFTGLVVLSAAAAVVQTAAGIHFGLYTGRWSYGCFEEIAALARTAAVTTPALFLLDTLMGRLVPRSAIIAAGLIALVFTAGVRYTVRLLHDNRLRPSPEHGTRVVVMGAGEGATQVLRAMLRSPQSPYVPVALLDDDPAKRTFRVMGVPVSGTRDDMADVVRRYRAEAVVIAIPSASAELIRALTEMAQPLNVDLKVVPPVVELFGRTVRVEDIRPVSHADLLGRREVGIDLEAVAGYLEGRRVLVTGAGGSIGSELCRQLARFNPAQLVMLDRDESGLHAVQLSLDGRGQLDDRNLVVADIRDLQRLDEVFAEHKPHVVFHAAALKHLPLLEMHPSEALKTNIIGTYQILQAAMKHNVDRLVNISTDKAADPCSVLGYSKRITERLTAAADATATGTYCSVRFGNVLGSRGSVLTAFTAQVAAGGPITVTHPDVTRYFMTVQEAVRLVIQAGALESKGEVLILDMGEPVRIADVAKRIADAADQHIQIVYTGLRPAEKLAEVLLGPDEPDHRPNHPLISQAPVPPLDGAVLSLLDASAQRDELIAVLHWLSESPALPKKPHPVITGKQRRSPENVVPGPRS
ncbi:nucleoside-diphosphate sugar epimerase/dehydratase [Actinoplanes derwentensis]|uniref:NDP-sugar epimerase, includes UDP-GlcNAc-inverting 4,6-dehydratase FlaA1 and capsular polysaccharide biosynthesis protein EpsC n=1 Tax=Actinoplanes derwentensis TaxID=113562 RepID=A0A1H2AYL3_9ACTN|nr:nucleoside-diphosphate sugar epimerase/dehydratase [Actinoplanes derwentensis]GID87258.1 dTDP-glucose 4,6-dehydratase [Actinoplanes derwentensis]SDT50636.1 NDP-sugar epimerase, includes UDP-GlcNAc-inverting 4,6-dehydratase FlaA1 and capsular polysaccharide biosynthesis protein EpsC [Actinoplanes derwentensis]